MNDVDAENQNPNGEEYWGDYVHYGWGGFGPNGSVSASQLTPGDGPLGVLRLRRQLLLYSYIPGRRWCKNDQGARRALHESFH